MTPIPTYPIAEYFDSFQGEGLHTGLRMFFIRLAGCNVGKYTQPSETPEHLKELRVLNPKHSVCTTALGQSFLCDTDYFQVARYSVGEILALIPQSVEHVCLTGGEPFLHELNPLLKGLHSTGYIVHIETSGTLPFRRFKAGSPIPDTHLLPADWITCSPKQGFLEGNRAMVDEWKFVVDSNMDLPTLLADIRQVVGDSPCPVYIQPANLVELIHRGNLEFAQQVVAQTGHYRISIQMHKVLQVR